MASSKVTGMDWTVVLAVESDQVLAALPGAILNSVLINPLPLLVISLMASVTSLPSGITGGGLKKSMHD